MEYNLVTCNGYRILASVNVDDPKRLPALCRKYEMALGDGYAVLASRNGILMADADGVWPDGEPHYTDAATATGMYDR